MGILSLLCVIFFLCTVTDFSAAEKARGVKFCMHFDLLSGQVFSPFGEDWLARSHGGGGITSHMNAPMKLCSDDQCAVPMKYYSVDRRAFLETNIEASGDGRWAFGTGGGGVD